MLTYVDMYKAALAKVYSEVYYILFVFGRIYS